MRLSKAGLIAFMPKLKCHILSVAVMLLAQREACAIIGGSASGTSADSPEARVDPNTTTSPFAGVGSIQSTMSGNSQLGTGSLISPNHVLTAAHLFDVDSDGAADAAPADVSFQLNFGSDGSHILPVSAITFHRGFEGFNNPSVNDDLAILTLAAPVPTEVPKYRLLRTPLATGSIVTLVGYGRSGFGDAPTSGAYPSTRTVKRTGRNVIDETLPDDDDFVSRDEVYLFDFDGPSGNGALGGPSLGNQVEANIYRGDSGGPAFLDVGGVLTLAGVNTFNSLLYQGNAAVIPQFGTGGGGMIVSAYADWIDEVTGLPEPASALALIGAAVILARRSRRR